MKIAKDKQKHFIAGAIIAVVVSVGLSFLVNTELACALGFIAANVIGILKEVVWDGKMGKGQYDVFDAIATTIGGLVAIAVYFLIR